MAKAKFIAKSPALRFLAALALLNLIWEIAQLPFYTLWRSDTWAEIGFAIIHCTSGDILIGIFSAAGAAFLTGMRWPTSPRAHFAFTGYFIAIGLSYTIFSEWFNVMVRKSWAYSAMMPVIPPLGTGLLPMLQWIIVPILAAWLTLRK